VPLGWGWGWGFLGAGGPLQGSLPRPMTRCSS
jgi:hypothetical protein